MPFPLFFLLLFFFFDERPFMLEDSFQGSPPSECLPDSPGWLGAFFMFSQHSTLTLTYYSKSEALLVWTCEGKTYVLFILPISV